MGSLYQIVKEVEAEHNEKHNLFANCQTCAHFKDMDLYEGICSDCYFTKDYPSYTPERVAQ